MCYDFSLLNTYKNKDILLITASSIITSKNINNNNHQIIKYPFHVQISLIISNCFCSYFFHQAGSRGLYITCDFFSVFSFSLEHKKVCIKGDHKEFIHVN